MKITRENYEAYFLDYHEGQLGEDQKQDVLLFLRENPDLRAEFEAFEILEVAPPAQTFSGKEFLKKKGITTENYNNYFAAYHEGDLSSSDRREVEHYAAGSPAREKELELYGKLKLKPDPEIVFKNKKSLRRPATVIQLNSTFIRYAAAAVIALLVITYFYKGSENRQVLTQENTVQPSPAAQHRDKQLIPGNSAAVTVAATSEQKKEVAPVKQKPTLSAQHHATQAAQHAPAPAANNAPVASAVQQKESPVPSAVIQQAGNFDSSVATTPGKEKETETFKPATADLKSVFSQDEMNELGLAAQEEQPKKRSLWNLASKGAAGLGKLTGTPIAMTKSDDDLEDTKTVGLTVGKNFSVSHTSGK